MKPKMSKAFLIENFVKMKSAAKEGLFEKTLKVFSVIAQSLHSATAKHNDTKL